MIEPTHRIAGSGQLIRHNRDVVMRHSLAGLLPRKYVAFHGPRRGRNIALTFDDGPVPDRTSRVLEILRQRRCRATFFVVGYNVRRAPELVQRIVDDGHEIGNHSNEHPRGFAQLRFEQVTREFREADELLIDLVGFRPRLVRPPYGTLTLPVLRYLRRDARLPAVLWSSIPGGTQAVFDSTADRLSADVRRRPFRSGDIVLLHDPNLSTVEGLSPLLDRLEELGLTPVTASELLGVERTA